ncbi:MAG: hypothetical protein NZM29_01575 [Nitrospira sp.]|nr:hypothetical protein [Nitrospira sp.]
MNAVREALVNGQAERLLVILGAGYTGRRVYQKASSHNRPVLATSRNPDRLVGFVPPERRLQFDLADPTTWNNVPPGSDILWCFPAEPPDLVRAFATATNLVSRRLVVLGSTSAYRLSPPDKYPPPWIDETAPLEMHIPRVQGEEFLRTDCHAVVLRVAGIYGPGRNPLRWISQGRVGPSRKYVNLIHIEDLVETCLAALERGVPGEAYNVSDGVPRTWKDICRMAKATFGIDPSRESADQSAGKRISNGKLLSLLAAAGSPPLYTDLVQSLKRIIAEEALT